MSSEIPQCRCKKEQAILTTRKQSFCTGCFTKFVGGKPRKIISPYMDYFKVFYDDPKKNDVQVLVPVSLGASSIALLEMMNEMLSDQHRMHGGRYGFKLNVLYLDLQTVKPSIGPCEEYIAALKERFNENPIEYHVLSVDAFFNAKLEKIKLDAKYNAVIMDNDATDLKSVFDTLPNKSSKEDLLEIISDDLIKTFAAEKKFDVVLWGHSMTRLADQVISLTVKGRGETIHDKLQDDFTVFNGHRILSLHPLRDVLLSEIDNYCYLLDLTKFVIDQDCLPKSTMFNHEGLPRKQKLIKQMTINELAREYFDSIEADYSNVISTVVRTGAKLDKPKTNETGRICRICNNPVFKNAKVWLRDITVNEGHGVVEEEDVAMFNKWKETATGDDENRNDGAPTELCYGCTVTLNTGLNKSAGAWPDMETAKVLEEYLL